MHFLHQSVPVDNLANYFLGKWGLALRKGRSPSQFIQRKNYKISRVPQYSGAGGVYIIV
jgi:hypothetical protein